MLCSKLRSTYLPDFELVYDSQKLKSVTSSMSKSLIFKAEFTTLLAYSNVLKTFERNIAGLFNLYINLITEIMRLWYKNTL